MGKPDSSASAGDTGPPGFDEALARIARDAGETKALRTARLLQQQAQRQHFRDAANCFEPFGCSTVTWPSGVLEQLRPYLAHHSRLRGTNWAAMREWRRPGGGAPFARDRVGRLHGQALLAAALDIFNGWVPAEGEKTRQAAHDLLLNVREEPPAQPRRPGVRGEARTAWLHNLVYTPAAGPPKGWRPPPAGVTRGLLPQAMGVADLSRGARVPTRLAQLYGAWAGLDGPAQTALENTLHLSAYGCGLQGVRGDIEMAIRLGVFLPAWPPGPPAAEEMPDILCMALLRAARHLLWLAKQGRHAFTLDCRQALQRIQGLLEAEAVRKEAQAGRG